MTPHVELEPLANARLHGRLVDPDGHPLPGLTLQVNAPHAIHQGSLAFTSGTDGIYSADEPSAGRLRLSTLAPPYLSVIGIELEDGADEQIDLALDWGPCFVKGQVVDDTGEPVPSARVAMSWSAAFDRYTSDSWRRTVTDARGYFLFSPLSAVPHALDVEAPGFLPRSLDLDVTGDVEDIIVVLEHDEE